MSPYRKKLIGALLAASASAMLIAAAPAQAADLKIALAADVSSLDPHFVNIAPNIALSQHMFDALVHVDPNGQLIPGLAVSWKAVNPTTWEFKLRPNVKFHDGSDLTAEDVAYSLDRPASLTNSPGPFTSYTKQIVGKEIVDAQTIRLKTATPYGPLPLDVSSIFIVSKKAAQQASTEDFNNGKAAVGSGPFKFGSYKRGDRIELVRNDAYWGSKPAWDKVTFRIIASDTPRLTALLAGEVDAIESVPTVDIGKVRANPKFRIEQKVSWRTIFWHLDQSRDKSPFVFDKSGKPLDKNPFKDVRVRQAISKAINRQVLVEQTMEGLAVPASNVVSPGIFGHAEALKVETYDVAGARKLLAEAGYPDGFAVTLHGPNNRYVNDDQIVQTTAQFLSRIGIQAKVETMPLSSYFGKARAGEFSMALLGWGSLAGDFTLRSLLGTADPDSGWGTWNWGKYSNPKVDQSVRAALSSVDAQKREAAAREGAVTALKDYAVIPLHHQYATWAVRKGVKYIARTDEFTFAHQFAPE
ncbi:ABC transporter substrate-binding protein [Noviherbaspirillum aerium]|uniref:ABC transporter substrate-binding protein n=1 Tax=Noviherbaspirillum aerium TaxID=2588497 RepID=UPI00124E6F07|nr:ABC transporter substrate-binding protein [Noviherbaspirillum aerium]